MSTMKIAFVVILSTILTSTLTVWLLLKFAFPNRFEPTTLNNKEQMVLATKINHLTNGNQNLNSDDSSTSPSTSSPTKGSTTANPTTENLSPKSYTESADKRTLRFSQREFNALLKENTDLAEKMTVHFSPETASAKFLIPLDPTFPIFGGKTLSVSAGFQVQMEGDQPQFILKGASLWGVPIPNAWLGNLKNVDLIETFGGADGFWQDFAQGIEDISIKDGELEVKLKE